MSASGHPGDPANPAVPSGPSSMPPPPPADLMPPPGFTGYGAPIASQRLSRVGGLARAIVVLQIASSLLGIAVLVTQLMLVDEARDYRADLITEASFRDSMRPYVGIIGILGGVGIASLVVLIVWTYRLSANLDGLGREPHTWRRGWGIVVWILQGFTLSILPYLMLRETWRGSDPDVPRGDPRWKQAPLAPVLHVWFILNLAQLAASAANGLLSVGSFSFRSATDNVARSLDERMPFIAAATVLGTLSTIALIVIVLQLTARHARTTGER